jgi:phage tail-like protein
MPLADPLESSAANGFTVSIDGIQIPEVVEVRGLTVEVDKIELKQQTEQGEYVVRRLIGRPKPGELTITRGLTDSKTITDWLMTVAEGDVAGARKTMAVTLFDDQGAPITTYNFTNCWVQKVEISSLKAGAVERATETFVVCFDAVTVS